MGKKIVWLFLPVCALCLSCSDNSGGEPGQDPVLNVGYTIGTRADAAGAPADKDTYTIMSYRVADLNNVATATPHVATNVNQRGHYVYLEAGNAAFVEEDFLVPVRIRNEGDLKTDYPYNAWDAAPVRSNTYGQKLQAGKYKTAVIHPAAAVIDCNNQLLGSCMVVLPRDINCPVYAPMPDSLFDMTVEKNMAVYNIDDSHKLYITLAKMKAYFYSSPDANYKIASVKLLNMGSSGWFNPYTGITYLNYGSHPREFSLIDSQTPADPANWRVSAIKGGTENLGYVTEADNGVGGTWPVHYLMDDEAVFASDYRGQSEGGTLSQYVKTIIMRITVSMPVPGTPEEQQITADIPISLKIERGKLYNFYFDVRSGIFSITYSIHNGVQNGWDEGNSDSGDLPIGQPIGYGSFDFVGGGGWVPENTGDSSIDIGETDP